MSKHGKSQNPQSNDCVLKWIDKLSTHFGQPQDEEQIRIFLHALRNCTVYQLDEAFDRCLNECQFMPKLADVHQRMPEQKYPPENPGKFVTYEPPIPDAVRPIAIEICKEFCGREYHELDTFADAKLIHDVFAAANRIRYTRMGIDTSKWGPPLEFRKLAVGGSL